MVLAAMLAPTPSQAADLAPPPLYRKAPAYRPFVPAFTWQGFYAGINHGYGFGKSTFNGAAGSGQTDPSGALLGSTLGYNFQSGDFVYGVEGDVDYSWMKATADSAAPCPGCEVTNHYLGTARVRLGYAMGRWMPYVTGGGAFGDVQVSTPAGGSQYKNQIGWTVGAGIEHAYDLWNMSAKLEYLYADLGSVNCDALHCGASIDTDFHTNIVRLGLNFHF
jgi:outer membrane immunogenic protein